MDINTDEITDAAGALKILVAQKSARFRSKAEASYVQEGSIFAPIYDVPLTGGAKMDAQVAQPRVSLALKEGSRGADQMMLPRDFGYSKWSMTVCQAYKTSRNKGGATEPTADLLCQLQSALLNFKFASLNCIEWPSLQRWRRGSAISRYSLSTGSEHPVTFQSPSLGFAGIVEIRWGIPGWHKRTGSIVAGTSVSERHVICDSLDIGRL